MILKEKEIDITNFEEFQCIEIVNFLVRNLDLPIEF